MTENNSKPNKNQGDITNYLEHYGFLIPNAKIYGGLAKGWDLGPHGVEIKKKIKELWWKYFIANNPYNVGSDSLIITHPQVLEASGHLKNFYDWLTECLYCQKRYRLDNLLISEELKFFLEKENKENYLVNKKCPHCQHSNFTSPRQFNLLLTTNLDLTVDQKKIVYLRPETCQGIFVNFLTIQRSTHHKLPFGIGQIGKSFRNEITLRHGIFRTREFEQMELEFFCLPIDSEKWWNYWTEQAWNFLEKIIINNPTRIKKVLLEKEELPHYARQTLDFYFEYHFGWGELCSNSDRGSYDLFQHSKHSQKDLKVGGDIPHVIEVSFGVERLMLAVWEDSYQEEFIAQSQSTRLVLKLSPLLAPYFVAIIPLNRFFCEQAQQLYRHLLNQVFFNLTYEESSSIGKSYRRQDAIGTYYCLTMDPQTLQDNTVTLRHRDTREQVRLPLDNLVQYLNNEYQKYWKEFFK